MSPVILLAAGAGAFFLLKDKLFGPSSTRPSTPSGPATTDPTSGQTFEAQIVSSFADGSKMVDVFLKSSGARILRFSQQGDDKSSRKHIVSPAGVDPSLIAAAMRAYGVAPKA